MRILDVAPGSGGLVVLSDRRGEELPLTPGAPFLAEILEKDGARVLLDVAGRLLRCETPLPLEPGTLVWLAVKEAGAHRLVLTPVAPPTEQWAGAGLPEARLVREGGYVPEDAATLASPLLRQAGTGPSPVTRQDLARAVQYLLATARPTTPEAVESVAPLLAGKTDLGASLLQLSALLETPETAQALPPGVRRSLASLLETAVFHLPPAGSPDQVPQADLAAALRSAVTRLGLDYEAGLAQALPPADLEAPPATPTAAPSSPAPALAAGAATTEASEAQTPAAIVTPTAPPPAETPAAAAPPVEASWPVPRAPEAARYAAPPELSKVEPEPLSGAPAGQERQASPVGPPLAGAGPETLKGLLILLREVLAGLPDPASPLAPPAVTHSPASPPELAPAETEPDQPALPPPVESPESAAQGVPPGSTPEPVVPPTTDQAELPAHPASSGQPVQAEPTAAASPHPRLPAPQSATPPAAAPSLPGPKPGEEGPLPRLIRAVEDTLHNLTGQRLLAPSNPDPSTGARLEVYLQLPVAVGDQRHTAELRVYREGRRGGRRRSEGDAALSVSCRLSTSHLGPVRVDLGLHPKGTTDTHLYLADERVVALFRAHEPELRAALSGAGLKAGQVVYSVVTAPPPEPPEQPRPAGPAPAGSGAIDLRL